LKQGKEEIVYNESVIVNHHQENGEEEEEERFILYDVEEDRCQSFQQAVKKRGKNKWAELEKKYGII
jgi:hypothetical protein